MPGEPDMTDSIRMCTKSSRRGRAIHESVIASFSRRDGHHGTDDGGPRIGAPGAAHARNCTFRRAPHPGHTKTISVQLWTAWDELPGSPPTGPWTFLSSPADPVGMRGPPTHPPRPGGPMPELSRRRALTAAAALTVTAGAAAAHGTTARAAADDDPGHHSSPDSFDEVYKGRRIQGRPASGGGHHHHGGPPVAVFVDGVELHVMQNADGTWIS